MQGDVLLGGQLGTGHQEVRWHSGGWEAKALPKPVAHNCFACLR